MWGHLSSSRTIKHLLPRCTGTLAVVHTYRGAPGGVASGHGRYRRLLHEEGQVQQSLGFKANMDSFHGWYSLRWEGSDIFECGWGRSTDAVTFADELCPYDCLRQHVESG